MSWNMSIKSILQNAIQVTMDVKSLKYLDEEWGDVCGLHTEMQYLSEWIQTSAMLLYSLLD